jgi:hypothetical protein
VRARLIWLGLFFCRQATHPGGLPDGNSLMKK